MTKIKFPTDSSLSNLLSSDLTFTNAVLKDCAHLAAFVNAAYRGEDSKQGWTTEAEFLEGQRTDAADLADFLNTPEHWIFKLEHGTQLLGLVQVYRQERDPSILQLGMLTVDPHRQRAGLGKEILKRVEIFARQNDFMKIKMSVISIRQSLIEYYQRRGFEILAERERFPYGQPRFGLPKRDDLEFLFLEKKLT